MLPMWKGRRLARIFVRYLLPMAIILLVGWYFARILRQPELREVSFACRVEWLLPAALLYLIAHSIWACFWVILLRNQGFHASYPTGLRAYFISQYGKYIPGKVWVILIRVVMLGASPKDKRIVGVTATYETLTSMAAGAILGAILIPALNIDLSEFGVKNHTLFIVAAVPIGIGLVHRLIVGIARRKAGPDGPPIRNMNLLVLARGFVQAASGWFLLGLSLWMTMQAVRPEPVTFTWDDLLRLTAVISFAYVLGFIALFLPGGAGLREFALATLLARELVTTMPQPIALGLSVVIALILRLIWTAVEVIVAVTLYYWIPAVKRPHLATVDAELLE